MAGKRTAAKVGLKVGRKVAPRAGKYAGRAALRAGKAQAKLARDAISPREPQGSRYLKYGLFALVGFAIGALVARAGRDDGGGSPSYGSTGHHTPDPGSPAGRRGETWGSGTPLGSAGTSGSGAAAAPAVGATHDAEAGDVPEEQEEVANRIRTSLGEDERTKELPRVNVTVTDGMVELRGTAPSEDAKLAAGEIAAETEGVREVRNLISVA